MHWTLWTILISVILLVIEFFIFKCFQVSGCMRNDWKSIEFPIFVILILALAALVPILNCAAVGIFPIVTMSKLTDNYDYMKLKPLEGNENNIMLHILYFLCKSV